MLISYNQDTLKCQHCRRPDPPDIRHRKQQLCYAEWQIPNNRFPKSSRLTNIEAHGLQTHQPLSDTSPTCKTVRNQNIGQSRQKPDWRCNLISGHDNEHIDELRNKPIRRLRT